VLPVGEGKFWKEFEKLKIKLSNEGLFDDIHKKHIPLYIKNIIIVTSLHGVVKEDIIKIIRKRSNYQNLKIYPVTVQGNQASTQISSAIEDINNNYKADVIIIARGGGSIEDLWPFNNEQLARTIFKSETPIISAIGHESDFTICDFVSDKRASTPSDAAKIVSINQEEMLQYLDELYSRVTNRIEKYIKFNKEMLFDLENKKVLIDPLESLEILKNKIIDIYKLMNINIANVFNKYKSNIELFNSNLSNLNPYSVLDRGYALLLDKKKRPISSIKEINTRDHIHSFLKDGELKMEVLEKNAKKRK
jgi:exodeoxyribonuclease VII large subunit